PCSPPVPATGDGSVDCPAVVPSSRWARMSTPSDSLDAHHLPASATAEGGQFNGPPSLPLRGQRVRGGPHPNTPPAPRLTARLPGSAAGGGGQFYPPPFLQ